MADRYCYSQCPHIMCMRSYIANIYPFLNGFRNKLSITRTHHLTREFIQYDLQKQQLSETSQSEPLSWKVILRIITYLLYLFELPQYNLKSDNWLMSQRSSAYLNHWAAKRIIRKPTKFKNHKKNQIQKNRSEQD